MFCSTKIRWRWILFWWLSLCWSFCCFLLCCCFTFFSSFCRTFCRLFCSNSFRSSSSFLRCLSNLSDLKVTTNNYLTVSSSESLTTLGSSETSSAWAAGTSSTIFCSVSAILCLSVEEYPACERDRSKLWNIVESVAPLQLSCYCVHTGRWLAQYWALIGWD